MKRLTIAALALGLGLATATGCSGGNEARCQKAIENIFELTGLNKTGSGPDIHAAVRSCRANASSEAIDCMIKAKSVADLEECEGGVADDLLKNDGDKQPEDDKPEENKGE
jgi:hypothetical protein